MIGIDTNVLIRLMTGDDARQRTVARTYLRAHCSAENPAFVNRIVLVETFWVLESVYRYTRLEVAAVLETLLRTAEIEVEDAGSAWSALRGYRKGADFADALVASSNIAFGCAETVSFDRSAARLIEGFETL